MALLSGHESRLPAFLREYLTVAEVYRMQHRLIELFGGLNGVRDAGAVEAAVFRPQNGYYESMEEEAAALMESLGMNHGLIDGNKRIAFTATDVFLRRNGFYLDVTADEGHKSAMSFASAEFWSGLSKVLSRQAPKHSLSFS